VAATKGLIGKYLVSCSQLSILSDDFDEVIIFITKLVALWLLLVLTDLLGVLAQSA
jgi:hypothetical protein